MFCTSFVHKFLMNNEYAFLTFIQIKVFNLNWSKVIILFWTFIYVTWDLDVLDNVHTFLDLFLINHKNNLMNSDQPSEVCGGWLQCVFWNGSSNLIRARLINTFFFCVNHVSSTQLAEINILSLLGPKWSANSPKSF